MSSDAAEIVTLLGFKCLQMTHVLVVTTHLSNAATAMRRGGRRGKVERREGGKEGSRERDREEGNRRKGRKRGRGERRREAIMHFGTR